jgi:hypothetical protein
MGGGGGVTLHKMAKEGLYKEMEFEKNVKLLRL